MVRKAVEIAKQSRLRVLTAIVMVMIIGLPAVQSLQAAPLESETALYSLFNPFTLETMEQHDRSSGDSGVTLLSSDTTMASTAGRSWIRIPYRPSLRSPHRPPL